MLPQFKQFLSPPVFPNDPDKTAVAKIVNQISLLFIIVLIISTPILIMVSGGLQRTLSWNTFIILFMLVIKLLITRGFVNQASLLLISVMWIVNLFATATSGGIHAPGYSVFVVLIVLAGILLGWRYALGIAILNSCLGLAFIWLDGQGKLPPAPFPESDFRLWLPHAITALALVVLLRVGIGSIRDALSRAQYELRKRKLTEEKFTKVFQSNPSALLISELENGVILDINESFERLSGYSKDQIIGQNAIALGIYQQSADRYQWVDALEEHGAVHELELTLRHERGEFRICLLSMESIELNNKACVITNVQDITEKRKTEQEILQTKDDLKIREGQLRTILNNLPLWVWLKDTENRFLRVNDLYMEERANVESALEVIGKTDSDFVTSESSEKYLREDQWVMKNLKPMWIKEPIDVRGESRIYEIYKAPYFDHENQVLGTFGFARDITEWNQAVNTLLENESRFRSMFEDAGIGMALVGLSHGIVQSNRAFAEMLGYGIDELIGVHIKDITYPDDREKSVDYHRRLIDGELSSYQFEKRYLHKDGHIVWALLNVSLVHSADGKPNHAIAQIQNIDDRKQVELDRELLIQELENSNAELEQFAYTVSHDLKSPLVTIGGFLGFLERDAAAGNITQLQRDVASIRSATEKMRLLLDELLELSRVGRVMNAPELVPFSQIVEEALSLTQGRLSECEVDVVGDKFPLVEGDKVRLIEVVQNLVDNAAKFMGEQSEPRIVIGVRHYEDTPIFFVEDNGIGILPVHHEKIFEIFNKLNPDVEGTGIGLALVKRIVEVHNGRLWVESDGLRQGSTICFTINETEKLNPRA